MLEALREGGPWKRVGGGKRLEGEDCLVGMAFCLEVFVGDVWEVGDNSRSMISPADLRAGERGANAMLEGENDRWRCVGDGVDRDQTD